MRCLFPLGVLLLIRCLDGAAYAQEPSATLRQADSDYREGCSRAEPQ